MPRRSVNSRNEQVGEIASDNQTYMTTNDAYVALLAHAKQTEALGQVAGLLSWDQEAIMPAKGGEARSEQAGAMSSVIHARRSDPQVAEWLDAIEPDRLDDAGRANLRLIRRSHDQAWARASGQRRRKFSV